MTLTDTQSSQVNTGLVPRPGSQLAGHCGRPIYLETSDKATSSCISTVVTFPGRSALFSGQAKPEGLVWFQCRSQLYSKSILKRVYLQPLSVQMSIKHMPCESSDKPVSSRILMTLLKNIYCRGITSVGQVGQLPHRFLTDQN